MPVLAHAAPLADVREILGDAPRRRDLLIEHLHQLQDRFGHLTAAHLAALAEEMGLAPAEVAEVASFYPRFDLVQAGEAAPAPLTVRVCQDLPCELAGAPKLLARLPPLLGAGVRVSPAPCLGRCEQAPAALVGQNPVPCASADKVAAAVRAGATRHEPEGYVGLSQYRASGGYGVLEDCLAGRRTADEVMAARQWQVVRAQPAPRLMAVHVGQGEPGIFQDRVDLECDPHRFLEGMLVAAWASGIGAIYIHLRDEYHGVRALLQQELDRLRADPPSAGLPAIELRRGAGGSACEEESALLEFIEGKRALPRQRPPEVAQAGLFGRPTLVQDVQSLARVRQLLERGADGHQGLRSFSVSGRVKIPGVKLAPAGTTLQELIDEHCGGMLDGHRFRACLRAGASGLVVLSHHDRASGAASHLTRVLRDASQEL